MFDGLFVICVVYVFFFQAEDGIRDLIVTGVQTCALPISTSYEKFFHPAFAPLAVNLEEFGRSSQRLGELLKPSAIEFRQSYLSITLGIIVSGYSLFLISKSAQNHLFLSGLTFGGIVVAAWYLTGGPLGVAWVEQMSFEWHPPRNLGTQSFTFVSPLADAVAVLANSEPQRSFTFGLISLAGIWFGSFAYHLVAKKLHLNPFRSVVDFARACGAGILLGLGGVLAFGCSIGQGVTGISTLAIGSILATLSMCLGAALALKMEFYRMMYPGKASWLAAFVASLVDFHLLPKRLRKLDSI